MADHPRYPYDGEHSDLPREPAAAPARPRWVSVLVIALAIALLVAFLVLHLTGVLGPGSH